MNLLCKSSFRHVSEQLGKTPEQHIADIKNTIEKATSLNMDVNLYLEDWSNGMMHSRDYVFQLIDALRDCDIKRFMLPDTLGILTPDETSSFCSQMIKHYPEIHFDFHAHNDYDLAVANTFEAIKAGAKGVHTTINGLGERAGNTPLTSIVAVLHDQMQKKTHIKEDKKFKISKLVEMYYGIRNPNNKHIIVENVFTNAPEYTPMAMQKQFIF